MDGPMLDPADVAKRLLNRDVTPARLRKLEKLITRSNLNREDIIAEVEKADADVAKQLREGVSR